MKVIDLYIKIANGEEIPKKIKFLDKQYTFEEEYKKYYRHGVVSESFEDDWYISKILNDEVEIIEDTPKEDKKIPEKLGLINYCEDQATLLIHHKVDEIIDYLKSKGE